MSWTTEARRQRAKILQAGVDRDKRPIVIKQVYPNWTIRAIEMARLDPDDPRDVIWWHRGAFWRIHGRAPMSDEEYQAWLEQQRGEE